MFIYNRCINVSIQRVEQNLVIVNGIFIDSIHEVCLTFNVDIENVTVIKAAGELKRVPHSDCQCVVGRIPLLAGLKLERGVRRKIHTAVGGQTGCTHLADLALECINAMMQGRYIVMNETMTPEETRQITDQILRGSCYHHK